MVYPASPLVCHVFYKIFQISLLLYAVCHRLKLKLIETFFSVCLILALEQVSEKVVGGFIHFFGHNSYSAIVVVARLSGIQFVGY